MLAACSGPNNGTSPQDGGDGAGGDEPSGPLRVLVIDDPELADALDRQWHARSQTKIEVRQATAADIAAKPRTEADVVIYPSSLLGTLAEIGAIIPLTDQQLNSPEFDRRDLLPLTARAEAQWGERTYAVSLGSPQLTLYYRADVFERLGLSPPATWRDYQNIAARLNDRDALGDLALGDLALGDLAPAEGAPWHGTIEPLGPGWAGKVLLARAAAYARVRTRYSTLFDYSSMEPKIAEAPFVRALEELVAASKRMHPDAINWSPDDVRRQFHQGTSAMALTWPTSADALPVPPTDSKPVAIGIALVPGSPEFHSPFGKRWEARAEDENPRVPLLGVSGRMVSITSECQRPKASWNLIEWLTTDDDGLLVAPASRATTLFRTRHLAAPEAWVESGVGTEAAVQYADSVDAAQHASSWLVSLRIPGNDQYLAALDTAVHDAIAGKASPAKALQSAAQRWSEITESLGVESQRRAYQRSLGLEP
jgi:multiple sugar transport system substrate-binding protein